MGVGKGWGVGGTVVSGIEVDVDSGATLVTVGSEVVPAWVAVEELLLHEVISKTSKRKKFIFRGIYTFHNLAKAALQGSIFISLQQVGRTAITNPLKIFLRRLFPA